MRVFRYTQTVIGACGHVCDAWPQVAKLGDREGPQVICDICTREEYGIDAVEQITIWVRIQEEEKKEKPAPKAKPKKRQSPALRQQDFWGRFL